MADLDSFVSRHGTALLETVDDWLAHKQQERELSGRTRPVSIRPYLGLYLSTDSDNAQFTLEDSRPHRHVRRVQKKRRQPSRS